MISISKICKLLTVTNLLNYIPGKGQGKDLSELTLTQ